MADIVTELLPNEADEFTPIIIEEANPTTEDAAISTVAQITQAMKDQLQDLLVALKEKHTPGKAVTPHEKDQFYQRIMTNWTTSMPNVSPDPLEPEGRLRQTAFYVGTLAVDCPSRQRGHRGRVAREYARVNSRRQATIPEHRRAGAHCFLHARRNSTNSSVTYQLVNRHGEYLQLSHNIINFAPGINRGNMNLLALKHHNQYQFQKIHGYNVTMTIFIARNRLMNWANGRIIGFRGEEEWLCLLLPLQLFRDDHDCSNPNVQLLATFPQPYLFSL